MVRSIIVDDEKAAVQILENYTDKIPFVDNVASFSNSIKALSFVQENNIDLVYLDINMPQLTGLGFMELLEGKAKVILTTAYSEYALDSYKYDVVDYLTKPIPLEDFLRASKKADSRINPSNYENHTEPGSLEDYIMVKSDHKGKYIKIKFSDIMYIQSMKNYVSIYTNQKDQIVTLLTLRDLQEKLPTEHFFRTHKSFIVSINQIKHIDGGEIYLVSEPNRIPLGSTYRDEFFEFLETKIM